MHSRSDLVQRGTGGGGGYRLSRSRHRARSVPARSRRENRRGGRIRGSAYGARSWSGYRSARWEALAFQVHATRRKLAVALSDARMGRGLLDWRRGDLSRGSWRAGNRIRSGIPTLWGVSPCRGTSAARRAWAYPCARRITASQADPEHAQRGEFARIRRGSVLRLEAGGGKSTGRLKPIVFTRYKGALTKRNAARQKVSNRVMRTAQPVLFVIVGANGFQGD